MSKISLQWKAIKPTVFFVRTAQGLRQAVDLIIHNSGKTADGSCVDFYQSSRRIHWWKQISASYQTVYPRPQYLLLSLLFWSEARGLQFNVC